MNSNETTDFSVVVNYVFEPIVTGYSLKTAIDSQKTHVPYLQQIYSIGRGRLRALIDGGVRHITSIPTSICKIRGTEREPL